MAELRWRQERSSVRCFSIPQTPSIKRRLNAPTEGLYIYEHGYLRVAGPFPTLEAAKFAAEMMYG